MKTKKKTIHFGGRIDLLPGDVQIETDQDGDSVATVRIASCVLPAGLPAGALLSLDAFRPKTGSYERLDLGTVGDFIGQTDHARLESFKGDESIVFELMAVDPDSCAIVCGANGLRAVRDSSGEKKKGQILRFIVTPNTGARTFKVDWEPTQGAQILVNDAIPDVHARLSTDPVLYGTIVSGALPLVLEGLLAYGDGDKPVDDKIYDAWMKLLRRQDVHHEDYPMGPFGSQHRRWMDRAVERIAAGLDLLDGIKTQKTEMKDAA